MSRLGRGGRLLLVVLPALALEAVARLGPGPAGLAESLARLAFLAAALALGRLGRRAWWAAATLGGGAVAAAVYAGTGATAAAWALTLALWVALFWLADVLADGLPWPLAAVVVACCAGLAGAAPAVLEQVEGGFAEEEFFSAVAAAVLAVGWALSYVAHRVLTPPAPRSRSLREQAGGERRKRNTPSPAARERGPGGEGLRPWLALAVALLAVAGGWATLRAYQASFLPEPPPPFAGVSAEAPFLCERIAPPARAYDGAAVFERLLALVAANPERGAPEYGMLALGSGERQYADEFRAALLADAAAGRFTEPANSVKYGQFQAAARAYYYSRVAAAFPGLFSAEDDRAVRAWFAAVNRRALTVEWVDVLYGAAFGYAPRGPYVNQESGAGLLAVLEATGLADPALSAENRAYLERASRGWDARWRNSDDTYYYQFEWITNALYQSLASGERPDGQVRRSLEWLRLQATPGGTPVGYNFPYAISADAILYLGAELLGDPRYLWAAGLAAASPARAYPFAAAQPGVDRAVAGPGAPPDEGTCLLYGDTGTPIVPGRLGPDKVVFREGWEPGDAYLLLNLRFTGWHRYKATNTVALAVAGAPLVVDRMDGQVFRWLPRGRSAFRDKRIPRENLSGLVVARSGMSAVRHTLAAVDGPWAQDPPPFARVERFATGPDCDVSVTAIDRWHGWSHRRTITFCQGGVAVIADEATGPPGAGAAIMWNLARPAPFDGGRARLDGAELVVLPLDGGEAGGELPADGGYERIAATGAGPRLRAVSVLLTGPMAGAEVSLDGAVVRVARDGRVREVAAFIPPTPPPQAPTPRP